MSIKKLNMLKQRSNNTIETKTILTSLSNSIIKEKIDDIKNDHDFPLISTFFELFASLYFDEEESIKHWKRIEKHRVNIRKNLKRDVGVKVAILDYFSNIENILKNPKIVEMELFEEILKSSKEDPKTGLYNIKYFTEILKNEINRAKRNNFPLSISFLDLDDFKMINDKYGHPTGDRILHHIAKIIKKMSRSEDVTARFGGDEFVILYPHTQKNKAFAVTKRIIEGIKNHPFILNNKEKKNYICNLSIGIASYPLDADSSEELMNKADIALYRAKKRGKNKIVCYEDEQESISVYSERRRLVRHELQGEEINYNLQNSQNKYKAFLKNINLQPACRKG